MSQNAAKAERFLLDDHGQVRSPDDRSLARHLHCMLSGEALIRHAILDHGYMEIRPGRRHYRVRCRPSHVPKISLFTLFFIIEQAQAPTIALEYFAQGWRYLVVRNAFMLSQFLTTLRTGTGHDLSADTRFLSRPSASEANVNRFGERARAAQAEALAARHVGDLRGRYDGLFNGRWTICALDNDAGHSTVVAMGTQYTPLNPRWYLNPIGQTLQGYAGADYGDWVTVLQRRVRNTGAAEYDDVDALVDFPDLGRARLRYSRATVPVRTRTGQIFLLSATESNALIDLRKSATQAAV